MVAVVVVDCRLKSPGWGLDHLVSLDPDPEVLAKLLERSTKTTCDVELLVTNHLSRE